MKKYGYKTFAVGGNLAGSLIAAPAAFAHGGRYSSSGDTSQSYAWTGGTNSSPDTFSSDNGGSFSNESPQFSNDSNPAPTGQSDQNAMNDQLQQDQDKLQQDLRSGASNDQIAEDQRAIELDQQGMQDSVASGERDVVVTPGS
ncbi:MAG TPA: hypothetical protein VGH50_11035 [Candidatus Binatia bacterium]|jgi:hypothetical protein